MRFRNLMPAAVGLATLFPHFVEAQDRAAFPAGRVGVFVTGRVVDQTDGRALPSARIVFAEPGPDGEIVWEGVSRPNGQFEIEGLPRSVYEIRVSLLSFTTLVHHADLTENYTMDFRVEMAPAALELQPVVVTALRRTRLEMSGFYERRENGFGITLTRDEIVQRNPNRVSDLFYGIPGARVVLPRRFGQSTQVLLRGNCVPQLVVDGAPFNMPIPIDEVLNVSELEAVEVYHGASTPMRYSTSTCGTILAWTREASSMEGSPLSLARLAGALGIVSLIYLLAR